MIDISDEQFETMIGQALDELPEEYVKRLLANVAVTWADEPTEEQRRKLNLREGQSLFGLYEGLPLPERFSGGNKITPDVITVFKLPITGYVRDMEGLKDQIKRTVWHEMAHYFGLNHRQIADLE